MLLRHVLPALALLVPLAGCAGSPEAASLAPADAVPATRGGPTPASPVDATLTFRDRHIDLEPFLTGQPYSGLRPDLERGQLLYFEATPEGRWLRQLPLGRAGEVTLAQGRRVNDIDWSTRTFWGGDWHEPSGRYFFSSDEANEERINVYALDADTGSVEQLTDNDYTYGWDLSEDGRLLGYLARAGTSEPFVTTLRIRDLETGEDRAILSDEGGADRFSWSAVHFAPDNGSVVVKVQHDGVRKLVSLARIDLAAAEPSFDFLHETRVTRYRIYTLYGWLDDTTFLYVSGEEGFDNVYRYDLETRTAERITDLSDDLKGVDLLETKPPTLLAVLGRPAESELVLLDPRSGDELARHIVPATVSLLDAHGRDAVVSLDAVDSPFDVKRVVVRRAAGGWSFGLAPLAGLSDETLAGISHLTTERVTYPTFDTLPDGSRRQLHAFLCEPRDPPEDPDDRRILIKAFYGGKNRYATTEHILGACGVATFSPAPRGSAGFGTEFAALNDRDLGGDEIVDILAAAEWLVKERGYKPHQIGVSGGSHGGYATMRCMTFPPDTNGRNASFDFGFGWSHAGFSDIITFYEECNIPDWVVLEAGDPQTERAKLLDRSPIAHVDKLSAPLLLTHGANDNRVPVDESRKFYEQARRLGKPVRYVEFEGQGHGIRGFENRVRYYREVLGFLESVQPTAE